jgi:hypothetical protein
MDTLTLLAHVMQRLVKSALRSTQTPGSSGDDFIANQRQNHTLNWDKQAIVTIQMSDGSILTFSYLAPCLIPFQLNKLDMSKELGDVKAGFVRRTPSSKVLIRKHLRARNRPEEVHSPLSTACTARIDIK